MLNLLGRHLGELRTTCSRTTQLVRRPGSALETPESFATRALGEFGRATAKTLGTLQLREAALGRIDIGAHVLGKQVATRQLGGETRLLRGSLSGAKFGVGAL